MNCEFFCRKPVRLIIFCFVLHATVDVSRALISFFFLSRALLHDKTFTITCMCSLVDGGSAHYLSHAVSYGIFHACTSLLRLMFPFLLLLLFCFFFCRVGEGRCACISIPKQVMSLLHLYICSFRIVVFKILIFFFLHIGPVCSCYYSTFFSISPKNSLCSIPSHC